ncbi:hypothetical protein QBC35DRAFT_547705 [Podospora australis]|uniref:Uncharacterized protein n=1 Tax=Podospora australis TaxID=1536484 RepID=A0AAN6WVQ8_9PEZI|nr:hypothetical protein QBC35DRAFT_547705 [Podospora australis]
MENAIAILDSDRSLQLHTGTSFITTMMIKQMKDKTTRSIRTTEEDDCHEAKTSAIRTLGLNNMKKTKPGESSSFAAGTASSLGKSRTFSGLTYRAGVSAEPDTSHRASLNTRKTIPTGGLKGKEPMTNVINITSSLRTPNRSVDSTPRSTTTRLQSKTASTAGASATQAQTSSLFGRKSLGPSKPSSTSASSSSTHTQSETPSSSRRSRLLKHPNPYSHAQALTDGELSRIAPPQPSSRQVTIQKEVSVQRTEVNVKKPLFPESSDGLDFHENDGSVNKLQPPQLWFEVAELASESDQIEPKQIPEPDLELVLASDLVLTPLPDTGDIASSEHNHIDDERDNTEHDEDEQEGGDYGSKHHHNKSEHDTDDLNNHNANENDPANLVTDHLQLASPRAPEQSYHQPPEQDQTPDSVNASQNNSSPEPDQAPAAADPQTGDANEPLPVIQTAPATATITKIERPPTKYPLPYLTNVRDNLMSETFLEPPREIFEHFNTLKGRFRLWHALLHGQDCDCPSRTWVSDIEEVLIHEKLERSGKQVNKYLVGWFILIPGTE